MITSGHGHHGDMAPLRLEYPDRPEAYPIRRKNLEASVTIQVIVLLLEVQKYLVENRLPHGRELLEQLGLKNSSPCPTDRPKPVQYVMECYFRSEMLVQKSGDRIPKHLYQANPPEVSDIPLGDQ